jgi:hypothetical protein
MSLPRMSDQRVVVSTSDLAKNAADLHDPTRIDAEHVYQNLLKNYPPHAISWVKTMPWIGPVEIPLDRVDWDGQDSWAASHQKKRVKKFQKRIRGAGKDVNPVTMVQVPGNDKCVIIDGHHRGLAFKNEGRPVKAYVGMAPSDNVDDPWFETHDFQYARGSDSANKSITAGNATLKHDILKSVTELSPEYGAGQATVLPTLWEFAATPEIAKVGREGYIHGWIKVEDVGPLGAKINRLSGGKAAQQDVLSALKSIPVSVQNDLVEYGHISDIEVGNKLPGLGKGVIGSYDPNTQSLKVKPDDEAGDTALHEAMHAWDARKGITSNPSWSFLASKLDKSYQNKSAHVSRAVEGRKTADEEKFADLAMQYLRGKPLSLGVNAVLTPDDTAMVEAFFKKNGLERG